MVNIGIDLGTTCTRVAIFQHGTVDVINTDSGMRMTPSCVTFNGKERFIGEAAKNLATKNPNNTVYNVKRLLGRRFHDPTVQSDKTNSHFNIVNVDGKPRIKVHYHDDDHEFLPEEISAMVLSNVKETVERHIGGEIMDVVITVPAYFNDAQRLATKNAAAIAGLNAKRLVNEPSAAASAYLCDKEADNYAGNIIVFHLGGGTLDVSVMVVDDGILEVLSTSGDTHLGGEDFDNRVLDYLVQEFQQKHKTEILSDKRALRKLRTVSEKAKRELSVSSRVSVEVDALRGDIDFFTSLTRETFEEVNKDLFEKALEHVEKAMKDSKLAKSDIRDIILVGSSTRIPKIKEMLSEFFDGKNFSSLVDVEESAVRGAAIHAAILNGDESAPADHLLQDIVTRSLFIEGVCKPVITDQLTLPLVKTEQLTTYADNQLVLGVPVYERDGSMTDNLLGTFKLTKIPPFPKGVPEIEMIFEVDCDGILSVSAKDKKTVNHIIVINDKDRLSKDDVDRMSSEAKWMKSDDQHHEQLLELKNNLESHVFNVKDQVENMSIETERRNFLMEKCDELLSWLDDNADVDMQQLEKKKCDFDNDFHYNGVTF